jgi:hypothetical protein
MGSYKVKVDTANNRFYLTVEGYITDAQAKACADESDPLLRRLRPGFAVISDITTAKPASPDGVLELMRTQTLAKELGMGRVIRVVPSETTMAVMQMARTAKEVGYEAQFAASVEEAEKMLDMLEKAH